MKKEQNHTPDTKLKDFIAERRAILEKASNGKWSCTEFHFEVVVPNEDEYHYEDEYHLPFESICKTGWHNSFSDVQQDDNAAHIADAHNHLEKLLRIIEIQAEALERNVKVIGSFVDRLTPEGLSKPCLVTAHRGMLEALHCLKRSNKAQAEVERIIEGEGE